MVSVYLSANKADRQKIRKAMLVESDKALKSLYPVAAQRHAAARVAVDRALAQENVSVQVASA